MAADVLRVESVPRVLVPSPRRRAVVAAAKTTRSGVHYSPLTSTRN